jgi:hypothetical protein
MSIIALEPTPLTGSRRPAGSRAAVHSDAARRGSADVRRYRTSTISIIKAHILMKDSPVHRGAGVADLGAFAKRFIHGRVSGFEKDIRICLTRRRAVGRPGFTHAYFPALGTCCATLEYFAGLYRGNLRGIAAQHIADWAQDYLAQPDYDRESVRVLFDGFRHPVAHRGIASGVWIDQRPGPTYGSRLTWKVLANSSRPACRVVAETGFLEKDPPWRCRYTHRLHIHLRRLAIDIRDGAIRYARAVSVDRQLQTNFTRCMEQLYPR